MRLLVSPVRSCQVGGSASGAEVFGYGVAFGDNRAGLVDRHWSAVDVAQDIWLSGARQQAMILVKSAVAMWHSAGCGVCPRRS